MENKIENVIENAMEKIRNMIDTDVVVGNIIRGDAGLMVLPLTKVTMGFVSGGGEYTSQNVPSKSMEYPFSGGVGGGINMQPIGFLVIDGKSVSVVNIDTKSAVEKLVEAVPEIAKFISKTFSNDDEDK